MKTATDKKVADRSWMTAKDVAAFLKIHTRTVWVLVARGELKSRKISAKITRFRREDVEALGTKR